MATPRKQPKTKAKEIKEISPLFVIFSGLFITCLLISNIIASKLISFYGITLTAAVVLFPATYIFGDVLTEVYGFKRSRLIIWVGFAANLFMALMFALAIKIPHPAFWEGQAAFASVLGSTPRIVIASLIGYWAGEFANSAVLSKMKVRTNGRHLWMRTIGSTIVGEGIDTLLFITLVFGGVLPQGALISMIVAQYCFKVAYEVIATPITYRIVRAVKKAEGVDAYDHGVKYNPFSLEVN